MKKKRLTRREFGRVLVSNVVHTFEYAYTRALAGDSIEAITIEHDILAANSLQRDEITRCQQSAIKSAVAAVRQRVPLPLARAFLRTKLEEKVEAIICASE